MLKNLKKVTFFTYKSLFSFSTNQVSSPQPFPYLFGGLQSDSVTPQSASFEFINSCFPENTFSQFSTIYKTTLQSIAQNNLKNINDTLEPNLLNLITPKNLELINPEANVSFVTGNFFVAVGSPFLRKPKVEFVEFKNDNKFIQNKWRRIYVTKELVQSQGFTSKLKYLFKNVPILFVFEIFLKSSMKLINQGAQINNSEEIHLFQFEVQGKLSLLKNMKIMIDLWSQKDNVDRNQNKMRIFRQMIGTDFHWKVGDIDRALKRNLNVVD